MRRRTMTVKQANASLEENILFENVRGSEIPTNFEQIINFNANERLEISWTPGNVMGDCFLVTYNKTMFPTAYGVVFTAVKDIRVFNGTTAGDGFSKAEETPIKIVLNKAGCTVNGIFVSNRTWDQVMEVYGNEMTLFVMNNAAFRNAYFDYIKIFKST